jgi:uncharacterized protein (DUF302 family)
MDTYGRRVTVDLPFDTAIDELLQTLKANGLAILGRTDVRDLLGRFAHHDFRRYVWIEVAIPSVALEALRTDLCVGAVLPTTIAVFELADGEVAVVVAEPFAALGSDAYWRRAQPHLAELADLTCAQLGKALMELDQNARTFATVREACSHP